jgi:hypothetical protein
MVWAESTEDFFSCSRPSAVNRFFTAADAPQAIRSSSSATTRQRLRDPNVAGAPPHQRQRVRRDRRGAAWIQGMRLAFWPEVWVRSVYSRSWPCAPGLLHGRAAVRCSQSDDSAGFDLERTQAVAADFAGQLEAAYPASTNVGVGLLPAKVGFENPTIIKPRILVLSSALALWIADRPPIICANLAVLQLARTASRARRIAIRLSLGCSRGRLTRQLLVESLLVAAPGLPWAWRQCWRRRWSRTHAETAFQVGLGNG